jgi:hypothetical protein
MFPDPDDDPPELVTPKEPEEEPVPPAAVPVPDADAEGFEPTAPSTVSPGGSGWGFKSHAPNPAIPAAMSVRHMARVVFMVLPKACTSKAGARG